MRKPYFLIRDMSSNLRERLEEDANAAETPLQEIIRAILCEHYELDCTEIRGAIRKDVWGDAATVLVKMQPELFKAIKRDAAESGESMRALIINALETRYITERSKT